MAAVDAPYGDYYPMTIANATAAAVYFPSADGWRLEAKVGGVSLALDAAVAQTMTVETSLTGAVWHDRTAAGYNVDAVPPADGTASFTAKCWLEFAGLQGGLLRVKFAKSNAVNSASACMYFAP